jgi:hypothetical protein
VEIEISEEVKEATTQCTKKFSCLSQQGTALCKVIECNTYTVNFVKCFHNQDCSYKVSWGDKHYICSCPTRKEIYKHYNM